jgi:hypothetical protein
MKVVTDFTVTSRPLRVGAGFKPLTIFRGGTKGLYWSAAYSDQVFADSTGETLAAFGQSVALVVDQAPQGWNSIQLSSALRPLLGRAPIGLPRRNLLSYTEDLASSYWDKFAITAQHQTGPEWLLVADASNTSHRIRRSNIVPALQPFIFSVEVKAGTTDKVRLSVRPIGEHPFADYDLSQGTVINIDMGSGGGRLEGGTAGIVALPDGWSRIWISAPNGRSNNTPDPTIAILNSAGSFSYPGAGEAILVRHIQFEDYRPEAAPSAYQRIGASNLDITEPVTGEQSFPFIRFDLSDDVVFTTVADGGIFDVMVFGRSGSWIERNVAISSGDTLNIGPSTITGGPTGLMAALGDIVGWLAIDRTLGSAEIARVVNYHKAFGAASLLETV